MDELLHHAVEINRLSRLEAEQVIVQQNQMGRGLETVLQGMGLISSDELDLLATILLQGYQAHELDVLRGQIRIARVIRAKSLIDGHSIDLIRELLRCWAAHDLATVEQLLTRYNLSPEAAQQAYQMLVNSVRLCDMCLHVNMDASAQSCAKCSHALSKRVKISSPGLKDAYDLLDRPRPAQDRDNYALAQSLADWVKSRLS